jgi:hypothetical protein
MFFAYLIAWWRWTDFVETFAAFMFACSLVAFIGLSRAAWRAAK